MSDRRRDAFAVVAILAVAILVRAANFGNPLPAVDEQFYLLVGDRMLHGTVPYIDLWDRKPIGLFLIYAAIRLLGGTGLVEYQLVATGFAAATATIVYVFARRSASRSAATMAGIAYLLWLNLAGGEGGQAPVFYNLPVAAAALIVGRLVTADAPTLGRLRWWGCAAMLLVGLAIQIKYTVVFEGMFFGCALLWLRWRRAPGAGLVADAALWIGVALVPTLLAMAAYWRIGQLDAFLFANVWSIAARGVTAPAVLARRFVELLAILAPLAAFGVIGRPTFVRAWLWVAIGALLAFGTWFDHYALPVILPAAIAAAPAWQGGRTRIAGLALLVVALIVGQGVMAVERHKRGGWDRVAAMRAAMAGQRNCPFVYDGPSVMYLLGGWCFATRYPFPAHHNFSIERNATGVVTAAEIERIMARRPDRVMTKEPRYADENLESRVAVYRHLARDYRLVARFAAGNRFYAIYALRPGRTPLPNAVR